MPRHWRRLMAVVLRLRGRRLVRGAGVTPLAIHDTRQRGPGMIATEHDGGDAICRCRMVVISNGCERLQR